MKVMLHLREGVTPARFLIDLRAAIRRGDIRAWEVVRAKPSTVIRREGRFLTAQALIVSPPGQTFFEIETYNGFLWAGTGVQPHNDPTPFSLLKTDATGDPYTFTTVIPPGAYKTSKPSPAVISLQVFASCPLQPCANPVNRLYVGTDRELLRVNPDDTWDLVVGSARKTPDGRQLRPLSGFDFGFDNFFNIHMWRMGVYPLAPGTVPWLYVGTHDQSATSAPS